MPPFIYELLGITMVHIGEVIKAEVYRQEIPVSVFAKRIGRSRNSIYDLFERDTVDITLLKKIGAVLRVNFMSFYDPEQNKEMEPFEPCSSDDLSYLELKQKVGKLEMEVSYLKKIIELQEITIKLLGHPP